MQIERLASIVGLWQGEWGLNNKTAKGYLNFRIEGDYITCFLKIENSTHEIPMRISFFGDYFYVNQIESNKEDYFFQLSFLNNQILMGHYKQDFLYAVFRKDI